MSRTFAGLSCRISTAVFAAAASQLILAESGREQTWPIVHLHGFPARAGVSDFLSQFVVDPNDRTAKGWVAKALLLAFPSPESESELTHCRAVLAPLANELATSAQNTEDTKLPLLGRLQAEPYLGLSVLAAKTDFIGQKRDAESRKWLFKLLIEVIASDWRLASLRALQDVARALRLELEDLQKNPNRRTDMPAFHSAWGAASWFETQGARYQEYVITSWKRRVAPALRLALLNPVPPPGSIWAEGGDGEGDELPMPRNNASEDRVSRPSSFWLVPDPSGPIEAKRSPANHQQIFASSLATRTPLSKFTSASSTWVPDEQIRKEMTLLLSEADAARRAEDFYLESGLLLRAFVAATSTAASAAGALRWEDTAKKNDPCTYPGRLAWNGGWLIRPELDPSHPNRPATCTVPIPIPRCLSDRIKSLNPAREPGGMVFPLLEGGGTLPGSSTSGGRPSMTALRRALISRLARQEPYGFSAAQFVAADDLGIDGAPLHYDRIAAADLVMSVAAVTFPWFGEKPGSIAGPLPKHFVGSRRVPELAPIKVFLSTIRESYASAHGDLAKEIRQRTRNVVHGLALATGHRPNDAFGRLHVWSFAPEDGIAVLSDKIAGADWQARPVVLPDPWVSEFRYLLADLEVAKREFTGRALGDAASKALDGTGPVFLDIRSVDDVSQFDRASYLDGLPAELSPVDNFARHFLNNKLVRLLPECLRVGQMGWHGTREGAWADGSPWSVLSAAWTMREPLNSVLKSVGWRPLAARATGVSTPLGPLDWACLERAHVKRFREVLANSKDEQAKRDAKKASVLRPKLATYLSERHAALALSQSGTLEHAGSGSDEPVALSHEDQAAILRFLMASDPRSENGPVARNLLNDLIRGAHSRGVVSGPIPRRALEHWPSAPGAFMFEAAVALTQFRELDDAITHAGIPLAAQTAVALLLHGGYADVEIVLRVMEPATSIARLEAEHGVLLAEPSAANTDDGDGSRQRHPGCLAFHGLAALHLWSWHRDRPEAVPTEDDIDQMLFRAIPDRLSASILAVKGHGALRQVAALARTCNTLRMDGWARPVGTGKVPLTTAGLGRVAAARDGLPVPSRKWMNSPSGAIGVTLSRNPSSRRAQSLLDKLFGAIGDAVALVDRNSRNEQKVRDRLIASIRGWINPAQPPRPVDLVATFALLLLVRGGRRLQRLELSTIQNYVYGVGRPIEKYMPDDPLAADASDWEAAYLSIVSAADSNAMPARVADLINFHWVLSQEYPIPEVSFDQIHILAGAAGAQVDAGFLTDAEVAALFHALSFDVEWADAKEMPPANIHLAKMRRLEAAICHSCALRPGEAARLQFADIESLPRHDGIRIRKSQIQRLKTVNARRRARLLPSACLPAQLLHDWLEGTVTRLGSSYSGTLPVCHAYLISGVRVQDHVIFERVGALARWATGEVGARTYWLRKTAIRKRLEQLMHSTPRSLWPSRDLIAEVGHGTLLVTLRCYTHDPITPFIRWFESDTGKENLERIAKSVRRSTSRIGRQPSGHASTTRRHGSCSRAAMILERAPLYTPSEITLVELPLGFGDTLEERWGLRDVSAILQAVVTGQPVDRVVVARSWSSRFIPRLRNALDELAAYGISLESPTDPGAQGESIPQPRWLRDHQAIEGLLDDRDALPVLLQMAQSWLQAMQYGASVGVPCSVRQWSEWMTALPVLEELSWRERKFRRTLVKVPQASKPGGLSPWPRLRWLFICAWIHARTSRDFTQGNEGIPNSIKADEGE